MRRRDRTGFIALVSVAVLAPLAALVLVRRGVHEAHAAAAPFATLAADSAYADSVAIASLPPGLQPLFALHDAIADATPDSLPLRECIQIRGRRDDEVRRRLQLRLPDSSAAVLFAIADRSRGTLERVEFLRRTPGVGQRGFIWERARDRTESVWWWEGPRGLSRRDERGEVPRGSPVPRAVRALGRQLFAVPCTVSDTNSPTNPISGSRD